MDFIPLGTRIVVKSLPAEEVTAGGIIIPDTHQNQPLKGTVEAKGDECKHVALGSVVMYSEHVGSKINIQYEEYLIMREEDIFGVFKPK